jgi:ABC-type Fe3+ transport system permease subunit
VISTFQALVVALIALLPGAAYTFVSALTDFPG